jgi:CBS-domain-containing membrane protein
MPDKKTAKELMVGIFEYPHIPYWFSINQAMRIIKVSFLHSKKYFEPMALLVFDEKYTFMGTVTLKDILKGIEPKCISPAVTDHASPENPDPSLIWDNLFSNESKELTEKPVSSIMAPARFFVEPNDPAAKAAYMMLHHDLVLLPVLEEKKKFVGLIRLTELFDEISGPLA